MRAIKPAVFRLLKMLILVAVFFAFGRAIPAAPARVSAAPMVLAPTPPPPGDVLDPASVQRLEAGGAKVSIAPQTGGVNFLVLSPSQSALQMGPSAPSRSEDKAQAFLQANRTLFGITDASQELSLAKSQADSLGMQHISYTQTYQGLPVFGGVMKVHLNPSGQIAAVNGLFVPGINLSVTPTLSADAAKAAAVTAVNKTGATAQKITLMIYREGIAQGIPGQNHLAYEVEVGTGLENGDLVYLDAHTGKVLNTITGVVDITRVIYDYDDGLNTLIWDEMIDPPYAGGDPEVQTMINVSGSTYQLYQNISGGSYRSFDGLDMPMISIVDYNPPGYCPNASWNGMTIQACDGLAVDDVIAHEWSHAYTDYTHDLIYQWQPGALNEAYSDIYGEMVDLLNGQGLDSPDVVRETSTCAIQSSQSSMITINSPAGLAGTHAVGGSSFAPVLIAPLTNDLVLVNDGVSQQDDGCETITNPAEVSGKIALIQRGTCTFVTKVQNAQAAGAAAVVIYNNSANGESLSTMLGTPSIEITIPAVMITRSLGLSILSAPADGVNATLHPYAGVDGGTLVDTTRWLMGEDTSMGVLRDMWDPTCTGNPGKVSDDLYYCTQTAASDNGGVHYNSGVPNHAFALLVDGGSYNGQTVNAIGMTRAAAIYWRAESVYQAPTTDFAGHADALEASCSDLTGQPIYDLRTGAQVSAAEQISAAHCEQLTRAIIAAELRTPPSQCNYNVILEQNPPDLCSAGFAPKTTFEDDFEGGDLGWAVDHQEVPGVTLGYTTPGWVITDSLPQALSGSAYYALNQSGYGNCSTIDDTSTRRLITPAITVPHNPTLALSFDHYVATETGYDGGNLWIEVNGGSWVLVDAADFTFNGYNGLLFSYPNTNPMAGLSAFHGADTGSVEGSWGTSRVDLHNYASPGDSIRLAFIFGQDGCTGKEGWYIDNVQLYSCFAEIYLPAVTR